MDIKGLDKEYIANTYARIPLQITGGKGSLVHDENGKEYIDLASGIAVNIFGMQDELWKEAVINQMQKLTHTSNLYYSEPCVKLAELLCMKTGYKKIFFSNSGTEANETAIKVIRKYSEDKKNNNPNPVIITLENSFHGRTLGALGATGQKEFHNNFIPVMPGFVYVPANDIKALKEAIENNNCIGFMCELIQGEGGVIPLDKDYVKAAFEITGELDIIFAVDEVQTGNGRTGKLYSYMNYDILPDIVTTAKGLGGGLPIGVTMLGEKVKDTLVYGSHGSTFGGNPVCAAGAFNILSRIDKSLLEGVKQKSDYIFSALKDKKGIKSVTGLGLMIGVETEKPVQKVIEECLEEGVLVIKAKNKVRLLPALNIGMEELKKAVSVLIKVCGK